MRILTAYIKKALVFPLFMLAASPSTVFAEDWEGLKEYIGLWVSRDGKDAVVSTLSLNSSSSVTRLIDGTSRTSPTIKDALRKFPEVFSHFFPSSRSVPPRTLTAQTSWPAPLLADHKYLTPNGPFIVADPYQGSLEVTPQLQNNPYVQCGLRDFQGLDSHFLPNLPIGSFYSLSLEGQLGIQTNLPASPSSAIRLYGPDFERRFGWVYTAPHPQECFSRTLMVPEHEPRRSYPIKFQGESGDVSHLLDCVYTPFPHAPFNSNQDWHNFVLGGAIYNQCMRKAITQEMGFSGVREMFLFDNKHVAYRHRLTWNKQRNSWAEPDIMPLHQGSIFICGALQSVSAHSNPAKVYFLPENDVSTEESIYKHLYENGTATYARGIVPQFEVTHVFHFFQPIIYPSIPNKLGEEGTLRAFYMGLNMHPFFSNVNNCLDVLHKADLPYSINFALGLTSAEISVLSHAIFSGETATFPEKALSVVNWNRLQLPRKDMLGQTKWIDAEDTNIPQFPPTLTKKHIQRFRKQVGGNLLEQVASSPFSTITMKLLIADTYLRESQELKAIDILKLACKQLSREGNIPKALRILELSSKIKGDVSSVTSHALGLISKKLPTAPLEELMSIRDFNQDKFFLSPVPNRIHEVREISPRNSKTLAKKSILYNPSSSQSDVEIILNLLEACDDIHTFSLADTVIVARDFWTVVDRWQEVDEYDQLTENHEMGVVSEVEYFWEYEKPLLHMVTALRKHDKTLQVLNLGNLNFGTQSERNDTFYVSNYLPYVLKTLRDMRFPQLEELWLTGYLVATDLEAIDIFEGLKGSFPNLKKVVYSLSMDREPIELTPELLPKIGQIFRSTQPKIENPSY
jgi:hypothetical protein